MTTVSTESMSKIGAAPPRILIAVHGYEEEDWAPETCRLLGTWASVSVRVLAVLDVPTAPFTSLTPLARRAYAGARAEWTAIESRRLEGSVEALRPGLPHGVDVAWAAASSGDIARTITGHARSWPADIVVVGGPALAPGSWLRPGPVHQRVVRLAGCPVLVVAPRRTATPHRRRLVSLLPAAAAGHGA